MDLHQDVFSELRASCAPALATIQSSDARSYEPFSALEHGEQYFSFQLVDGGATANHAESSLHAQIQGVDQLDVLDADELRRHGILFYAIIWPRSGGGFLGFVTKSDPRKSLRPGFRYFQFGQTLRRVDQPDLVISDGADLVIRPGEVAALSESAFKNLFSDLEVVFASVSTNVDGIEAALATSLPLSPPSSKALRSIGSKKVSVARRLDLLVPRLAKIEQDPKKFRAHIKKFGFNPADFVDRKGQLIFTEENVEQFLDFAEGRVYEDELGLEQRRADRFSSIVRH
jgi:hypothetical protein